MAHIILPGNARQHIFLPSPHFMMQEVIPAQYLFIPDDITQPIRQADLQYGGPTFVDDVDELLGLKNGPLGFIGEEWLWTEGQLRMPYPQFKGEEPFPPLHEYLAYQAIMDDYGNMTRAHNKRAAELLRRPVTHGSVLVAKMIVTRKPDEYMETVLRFEELTEQELRSNAFSKKRREWHRATT
ncbi:unnamed protein product [Cyclocybe aegerita]|uniref:Uncharacterized protein n=1 Tax=Cyclocybe aegerita TaxID=1973307 RepID=A0A8S0VR77_CYCAE|nr:unnamed protein product [Cyclocybe aegerita]